MSQQESEEVAANKFLADTARANELFVEAAKLMMKSQDPESESLAQAWLEEGFHRLTKIIENYSSTDLAVKLISGQSVGGISLESYGEEISHWEKHGRSKPTSGDSILDEAAIDRVGLNDNQQLVKQKGKFRLHSLRDSYASNLVKSGKVELYDLQKILGHTTPTMTQKYAHLKPNEASKKAKAVLDSDGLLSRAS